MSNPPKEYSGTLRPEITLIEGGAQIVWRDKDGVDIWTEQCTPEHPTFASQIECTGDFKVRDGYFRDSSGQRHFVMQAEAGMLGAIFPS